MIIALLAATAVFAAPSKPLHVPLLGADGQSVGEAILTESGTGVKISLTISKLTAGIHGIHIHENGVCTPVDFKSAGIKCTVMWKAAPMKAICLI
jgi:Cu-Zn family superoxide dismutase